MALPESFCGGESSLDDCIVEYFVFLWPCYVFLLILLPLRAYEIRLLPRSYPPRWWPLSHMIKRALTVCIIGCYVGCTFLALLTPPVTPYVILTYTLHLVAWISAYWILSMEYKRYQPVTWFGLRGFWFFSAVEGALRLAWILSAPEYMSFFPFLIVSSLSEMSLGVVAVIVPSDLNISLLNHIQRLLLEHPSANEDVQTNLPEAVYTLQEDNVSEAFQAKRADTPGWIYSVEEELPFRPKVDVLDVQVVAINRNQHIETAYRIHTRVSTDSDPPMVVEFNCKRRYKELRWLDDRLRAFFAHSAFPEQRASLGNFPPRELTQADPFARQVAFREYLRRMSQSPIFYCHEFLDMVGVDPRFDAGRLYESCLGLQHVEQGKVPARVGRVKPPAAEQLPWRPPMLLSADSSGTVSPLGSFSATPPPPVSDSQSTSQVSVTIPDYATKGRNVVYYRIQTVTPIGLFEARHRFSDFQRLNVHLRDFLDVKISALLPPLVRIPGISPSPHEFLEDRRKKLEGFLQTLLREHPSVIAVSRFVRTFFKLPTDSVMVPASHAETDEDGSRLTPTSAGEFNGMFGTLSPGGDSLPESDAIVVTIPFFYYSTITEVPEIHFCCRVRDMRIGDSEWTRNHSFDSFAKLKSELNVNHAFLVDSVPDFPTTHSLWPFNRSGTDVKTETEGRRRMLEKWVERVIAEAAKHGMTVDQIPPLWNLIKPHDDDSS